MAKNPPDFDRTIERLRSIIEPYAASMIVTADTVDGYSLDTAHIMKNGQRLFFAGIRRGRNYVSFYLMPVYVQPELLEGLSPALRKRMQGKSCFNFKSIEDSELNELAGLVMSGLSAYKQAGYL